MIPAADILEPEETRALLAGPDGAQMNRYDMLAKLITQAREEGGGLVTPRAIVVDLSGLGAERVLRGRGASEDSARGDLRELRELLSAWRSAKASACKATVERPVRSVFALLLVGIAARLDLSGLLT